MKHLLAQWLKNTACLLPKRFVYTGIRIVLGVLLLFASCRLSAQDAQYWNVHYGTKGVLLSGAIIGSVDDLSAIYYNPGFLGIAPKPGLSVGTGIVEMNNVSVSNPTSRAGVADRITVSSSPGLVAGQVNVDSTGNHHITFGLLGRQVFTTELQSRTTGAYDDGQGASGTISREVLLQQDQSEYWGGVSYATSLSKNLGVGITLYGALRTQRRRNEVHSDGYLNNGNFSVSFINGLRYFALRMLAKTGIYYKNERLSGGLTITTPSFPVFGTGRVYTTESIVGASVLNNGTKDALASFDDVNRWAMYKSPLSVGIGGGYQIDHMRLHLSAEWFNSMSPFEVIETSPHTDPVSGIVRQNIVQDQLRSVINIGAGIEIQANDQLSWYASLATDMSAVDRTAKTSLALATWDIYHISGGGLFKIAKFSITAGIGLAYGSSSFFPRTEQQATELAIFGTTGQTTMTWWRIRALVGLQYGL